MIHRVLRTAGAAAALLTLASGIAGCDAKTASATTSASPADGQSPPAPAVASTPPLMTRQPEPGLVRVTGIVFRTGGDGAFADQPFERGTVAAIPLDRFKRAQAELLRPAPLGTGLRDRLAVPIGLLREDGIGTADLAADGTYAMDVRPGRHAFCLIELGGKRPPELAPGTRWIERWIEVDVTEDELQTILPVYNRETGETTILY
ncbi:MAG: hypothetical protein VKI81_11055 [Synechococcaceae cyanobacterium]|nr:hypothetical protein [Synechococcaceae cyanobacterium]